jgi:hypothetical protein
LSGVNAPFPVYDAAILPLTGEFFRLSFPQAVCVMVGEEISLSGSKTL